MSKSTAVSCDSGKNRITLSITGEDKLLVKRYALEHNTTVSDLLHDWIQKNCRKE